MKRTLAIIFMLLFVMSAMCGCQKEVDMVEDMVSTIMSDNNNDSNANNGNNGTVTDGDGFIGNEDRSTSYNRTETSNNTEMNRDNNVM